MRKLIIIGSILLSSLCLAIETDLNENNYKEYYVKYKGKLCIIEYIGWCGVWGIRAVGTNQYHEFDEFVLYLQSIDVTLVKKKNIKFKVEEE